MKTAKSSDWQRKELPSRRITIPLRRSFSSQEIERMRMGLVPRQMEDKWFVYWENDTLYFHRSWTGICIYVVRFTIEGDHYQMVEADVNRDPTQHSETTDDLDAKLISYLIDVLLLHQAATFPSAEPSSDMRIANEWGQVGRAMIGQHPNQE